MRLRASLLFALLACFLCSSATHTLSGPRLLLQVLAKAAEQFGKGQELDNFKISGALEVRQAGKEFIKMKNRILKQIDQRSLMLAGVSHDLKTPLTRMKLIIETLDNKDIKKDINDEINHMNEMLIEYLDFAASDDSKDRSVINPIAVSYTHLTLPTILLV